MTEYKSRQLLTKNESKYFDYLDNYAKSNNLKLFAKVRLADIIAPNYPDGTKEYYTNFNRIKAKHIDFVLCEKDYFDIVYAIEIDDYTHNRADRQKRDDFVDNALDQASIKIIHVWNVDELEEKLKRNKNVDETINIEEKQTISIETKSKINKIYEIEITNALKTAIRFIGIILATYLIFKGFGVIIKMLFFGMFP